MSQSPNQASQPTASRAPVKLLLAEPRGFCAGVDRAIQIVELALKKYGAPVYVRHEIVHNRFVVESLENKGAIFVEELDEVPEDVPVVFSAHGVPKAVPAEAKRRDMVFVDATCPLVSKVHREVDHLVGQDHHILMIGHEGHPEVIGTMGQVEDGAMTLVETVEDVAALTPPAGKPLAYVTQTTLSVFDTAEIVAALQNRFPEIAAPKKEDICYATTNRQEAVSAIAERADKLLVLGAPNSSNSKRLVEVGERLDCPGRLVERAADIDFAWLEGARTIGITAGASAPEVLVQEVVDAIKDRFGAEIETITTATEDVVFKVPGILKGAA